MKKLLLPVVMGIVAGMSLTSLGEEVKYSPKPVISPQNNLPTTPQSQNLVNPQSPSVNPQELKKKVEALAKVEKSEKTLEYMVPCLTVRGRTDSGNISYLPMKFTRTNENKPLRVMITDDTPGGSSQTIHSSVWLATITAAMLRNNTLHGVTISIEFSGNVDGPSAGGVICIAILSAIDGVPLPKDFAMTGTILPDGTIGVVGGVPAKMRAAAKSGVKRIFIPAFLRIEKNEKGEDVDLDRLADELKVKLYRVENIAEAYAILNNKPYHENDYVNVREITKLSREVENIILPAYKDLFNKISERIKSQSNPQDPNYNDGYVQSLYRAQSYYEEGRLLPAIYEVYLSWQLIQARDKANYLFHEILSKKAPYLNKIGYLKEYHYRKLLPVIREAIDQEIKNVNEEQLKERKEYIKKHNKGGEKLSGYYPFADGLSEITAQLEPIAFNQSNEALLNLFKNGCTPIDQIANYSLKELMDCMEKERLIFALNFMMMTHNSSMDDFLGRLGKALPPMHNNEHAADVEQLFYSATFAMYSATQRNIGEQLNALSKRDEINAIKKLEQDYNFWRHITMSDHAYRCHDMLTDDLEQKPSNPAYHLQASLLAQVISFANSSAVLAKYGENKSNDFIPHLWRNARSAAIRNINDCVKSGIPCLQAICDFETAEASRNNSNDGGIDALISYWQASLYAKALLMSFKQK